MFTIRILSSTLSTKTIGYMWWPWASKTTHRPKEFYSAGLHPCSRVLEFLDPPLILFMMADFVVWSWKGNGWFRAKHMFTLGGYAFKSVSPVKPCKVVQKQGSPICMKFCEQVTLYPSIVNLNFFFDWFNMAAL